DESFERNLKEAVNIIFDDHGLDAQLDDDFLDSAEIDGYDDEPLRAGSDRDEGDFEEDDDDMF
ncbi:MAG: hypothetical protein MI799_08365, partial [Desulfobacterales bacterium]|nr:hypothetical protein [Desulfobacterales bacterium]